MSHVKLPLWREFFTTLYDPLFSSRGIFEGLISVSVQKKNLQDSYNTNLYL